MWSLELFGELVLAPVAVRIVTHGAMLGEGGPRASAATDFGILASFAEPPQKFDCEFTIVGESSWTIPDFGQRLSANITFDEAVFAIHRRWQRQAPLDVTVAFYAYNGTTCGAASPNWKLFYVAA
jgi:hypothetical protein